MATTGWPEPAGPTDHRDPVVAYRIDVPRFADGDGDGVGDLPGLIDHLGYLELVGVDAVVLAGVVLAADGAGTVTLADPRSGDVVELDRLVAAARAQGLRVLAELDGPNALAATRFWLGRGLDGVRVGAGAHSAFAEIVASVAEFGDRLVLSGTDPDPAADRFGPIWRESAPLQGHVRDAETLRAAVTAHLDMVSAPGRRPAWSLGPGPEVAATAALLLFTLALPGSVVLDAGTELGLPDPDFPAFPWEGPAPGGSAEAQLEDPASLLSLTRIALELRSEGLFEGDRLGWYGTPPGCLAFRPRRHGGACVLNLSAVPVLPPDGAILVSSRPLDEGRLPAGSAAWLRV